MKRGLIIIIVLIIVTAIASYFLFPQFSQTENRNAKIIENPLKNIVQKYTDEKGKINQEKIIEESIQEFNVEYINYVLLALGVGDLSTSSWYGNPKVELIIDNEVWSSEIIDGRLQTAKQPIEDNDIAIYLSKREMVNALLSSNLKNFIINSVKSGNTKIEMKADKIELFTKGYLKMYQELTG